MIAESSDPTHLDSGDDLVVSVVSFDPRGVVCSPQPYERDPFVLRACQTIVDQMRTSRSVELFAQQNICDPHIETPLPFYYTAPFKGSTDLLYKPLDWPADQEFERSQMHTQSPRQKAPAVWELVQNLGGCSSHHCNVHQKGEGGLLGRPW